MLRDGCGAPLGQRPLIAAGAQEEVVKVAVEQTENGFELLMADRHLCGKIAFDGQWQFLVARLRRPPRGHA